MKPKEIILKLCKLEGLKKQVNVAQMSEIFAHLSDMIFSGKDDVIGALIANGKRRAERKKKKKA